MGIGGASYTAFSREEWRRRIDFFSENHRSCSLCPRRCGAERPAGGKGACQAERDVRISSFGLHFGEEPPVSGFRGSGTVFFSGCTLRCVFSQNHPISQEFEGEFHANDELAGMFLYLQKQGAHNINLVSPTPYLLQIVSALEIAAGRGLTIPVVYNTGCYERAEMVRQLAGLIDIYMPDLKYSGSDLGSRLSGELSGAADYFAHAFPALAEMRHQVGPLRTDDSDVATMGTIVRHLIIPGHVRNSLEVLDSLAEAGATDVYLSLMSQYHPSFKASDRPDISRRLNSAEYIQVRERALQLGFSGWFQDM